MIESLKDHQTIVVELIRKYAKLSMSVSAVVLLAVALWVYWQHYQLQQTEQASTLYAQLIDKNLTTTASEAVANQLIYRYSRTPYAKLAALMLAQRAVNADQLGVAAAELSWVVAHKQQAILSQLAQIRLARILLVQQQPQAALAMSAGAEQFYPVETSLVRAKALFSLGEKIQAHDELQRVITILPADSPMLPIVELYLNDL